MKNKISYKLIVFIFLICSITTIISTYINIKTQYKDRVERFERSLENIKENQLPILTESLWKVDNFSINIFLENLIHNEKIIYAEIVEKNKITYKMGVKKKDNIVEKKFPILKKIDQEEYDLGTLIILADMTPLYSDLKSIIKGIIFTEIIKLFLLSMLIIFILKKLLTNPLERIAEYAKELFIKNLEQPLEIKEKDITKYNELDIVSNSINIMRVNLINQIKEREELLNKHNEQLKDRIIERDIEIEARKKVENEILKLNQSLEIKVQERTKDLEDSLIELKKTQASLIESEKMASLGQLVAGVAHEINTPVGLSLTGITHFISESQRVSNRYKQDELTQEEFENFIELSNELAKSININLEKTAKLVKSFKEVAVDQSSDDKRKFKIKEYLDDVILSIRNITKKTKIKINIDCDSKIEVYSYPGSISQIITNLILNSLNHAYDIDDEDIITISIKKEDKNIVIIYSDYGKGISRENLSKIFDPFFTTNRDGGGSGLGLSVIYNIVTKKLNGTIACESEENKGTTFMIKFNSDV